MRDAAVSASIQTIAPLLDAYALAPGETSVATLSYPRGDPRRYGAPMNGIGNDSPGMAAAISNAIALRAGTLKFPIGTLTPLTNIVAAAIGATPTSLTIKGYGRRSIIQPGPAVTVALTIGGDANDDGTCNPVHLRDFAIDGVNTTGAVGLLMGENAGHTSAYCEMRGVRVYRFTGVSAAYAPGDGSPRDLASPLTSAANLVVKDIVGLDAHGCYFGRGYDNVLIRGGDLGDGPLLPTCVSFQNCQFREAAHKSVRIRRGYRLSFKNCTFESDFEEGLWVGAGAGELAEFISVIECWCEGHLGVGAPFAIVGDGSLGGEVNGVVVRSMNFNEAAKSISFKSVNNFVIDDVRPRNAPDAIHIDTFCSGRIKNFPLNNYPLSVITNLSGGQVVIEEVQSRRIQDERAQAAHLAVDVWLSDIHQFDMGTNAAYTVDAPTNGDGGTREQVIKIVNLSGGALGVATWAAAYQLSEAWVNPPAGSTRIIKFLRSENSGKFQQTGPSTLVAN